MPSLIAKALQGVLTVLALVFLVFLLVRLLPGDPARAVAGELASPEDVERVRQEMGLDQPLPIQVANYLERLAVGDLGVSVRTFEPVLDEINARVGRTLLLGGAALGLALLVGIGIALLGARWPGSAIDGVISVVAVLAYGTPVFWVALIAIDLFAVHLQLLPSGGQSSLLHLVLPASVLSLFLMGPIAQVTRTSLSDVMSKDYILVARAKGVGEWRLLLVHALRNAFLPTLAFLGTQIGVLFGGAAITETIFAWNGLGSLIVDAALTRDYPLLQGLLLVIGIGFVVLNLVIELAYALIDPRMRARA